MAYQTFTLKCELDHEYLSFTRVLKSHTMTVQIRVECILGGKGNADCSSGASWGKCIGAGGLKTWRRGVENTKEGRRIIKTNITSITTFTQEKRKNAGILFCHMVPVSTI